MKIRICGEAETLDELKRVLSSEFGDNFKVLSESPYRVKTLDRKPYRQLEWYEILISIGTSAIGSAGYEALKAILGRFQNEKEVEVEHPNDDEPQ